MGSKLAFKCLISLWPFLLYLCFILYPLQLIFSLFTAKKKSRKEDSIVLYDHQNKQSLIISKFLNYQNVIIIVQGILSAEPLKSVLIKQGFRVIVLKMAPRRNSQEMSKWIKMQKMAILKYANDLRNSQLKGNVKWIVMDVAQVFFTAPVIEKKVLFVNPIRNYNIKMYSIVQFLLMLNRIAKINGRFFDLDLIESVNPILFTVKRFAHKMPLTIQYIVEQFISIPKAPELPLSAECIEWNPWLDDVNESFMNKMK